MNTEANNELFLQRVAAFLNDTPDCIDVSAVCETADACGRTPFEAYLLLLAGALDLYENHLLRERYLRESVSLLDPAVYRDDPYRKLIRFPVVSDGAWTFAIRQYRPYELFVCGDMVRTFDGRVLPQLGCFSEPFSYPCVLENGRIWMSVTPNEIETMRKPIRRAHGSVAAYGLGMGYYAFSASEQDAVHSVTVVERDPAVIRLFETYLLPQFLHRDKVHVVQSDALAYAAAGHRHDVVFADLWHDVSDGLPLWRQLKLLEQPDTEYTYWIEDTMRLYDR